MKHKEKLYFPEWDDEYCAIIQYLKEEAKREGISEFEAYEAVYDPSQKWYCYCKKSKRMHGTERLHKISMWWI